MTARDGDQPSPEEGHEEESAASDARPDDEPARSAPSHPDGHDDADGPSRFNTRGQRVNEIDLDARKHPTKLGDMTAADWVAARAALRAFDAGQR